MSTKGIPPSKLISAIREGRFLGVVDALDEGCDVEEADMHGQRGLPLRTACFQGDLAIIKELIARGADVNASGSDGPCAPLRLAVRCKHKQVVALLMKHGANIPEGLTISPDLLAAVDSLDVPPLELAAPALAFEHVQIPSVAATPAKTEPAPAETGSSVIEDIDIPSTFGTDTNLLTMEMLRFNDSLDNPQPAAESARDSGSKPGFWKSGRQGQA